MYYFAYGSNLNLSQMLDRCQDAIPVTQGLINNYELLYRGNKRGIGVATIEPKKGKTVYGAIYEVSEDDVKALDRYEGFPWLYYKEWIEVETRGRGMVKALVYVMHTDRYSFKAPSKAYFETILTGYEDWALPVEILDDSIENIG